MREAGITFRKQVLMICLVCLKAELLMHEKAVGVAIVTSMGMSMVKEYSTLVKQVLIDGEGLNKQVVFGYRGVGCLPREHSLALGNTHKRNEALEV